MFYDDVTVGQFCNLYIEDTEKVQIFDLDQDKVVFEGTYPEAEESEYSEELICSFGIENGLNRINISLTEG